MLWGIAKNEFLNKALMFKGEACLKKIHIDLKVRGELELSPISDYLDIQNWKEYLNKKVIDDVVQLIKISPKANRPAGNSKFISKLEKLTGRSFSFNKKGKLQILLVESLSVQQDLQHDLFFLKKKLYY